ncbi:hypothetical protein BGAL_0019g00110 [Botrytis galanthina]|uniref:Uncharacterized protein n=1 Tax=Botrytis galanthina TaxID=278940 RepID=A0A4S8RAQ7_9HELO|nr:hypothetical protein BGAL_0019g00110 [Botrytis galanthina]
MKVLAEPKYSLYQGKKLDKHGRRLMTSGKSGIFSQEYPIPTQLQNPFPFSSTPAKYHNQHQHLNANLSQPKYHCAHWKVEMAPPAVN